MPNKLTKNLTRDEFACQGEDCCDHSSPISLLLVASLQELRNKLGSGIEVTSGFRCVKHNKRVGGAASSFHCLGLAADVKASNGTSPKDLARLAEEIYPFQKGGIGIYRSWIHLDVRNSGPARWTKS